MHGSPYNLHVTASPRGEDEHRRMQAVFLLIVLAFSIIIVRLFFLMILRHDFYTALAAGSHEIYQNLVPERGNIYLHDNQGAEYPLAMNKDYFVVYADTRFVENEQHGTEVAKNVAAIFGYDEEKTSALIETFKKQNDPYEPIEMKVDEEIVDQLKALDTKSIGFIRKSYRYYPEHTLAAQITGFLGKDDSGTKDIGRYGIEGYWEKELAGEGGFVEGVRAASGGLLSTASKSFKPAKDGADIVLTIDRTLQFKACEMLEARRKEYEAQTASLIIMNPKTGAIMAMCSTPQFDVNVYSKVGSIDVYNNTAIYTPYEPGSIFKPIVMASALNEELVKPSSVFHDSGVKEGICETPISNADKKIYNDQTMTGVLENSINTGMVYVAELLGKNRLKSYISDFGFGVKTGIQVDSERTGTIDSLSLNKWDKLDCYGATASFGQGITATPLQMVTAFSALANGGTLMKPYIVDEVRFSDGNVERYYPKDLKQVVTKKTSQLISGMLVNVIDSGQAKGAAVPGYYIAGKTGTAQIPGKGGYTEETNHSFVGYGPVDDPAFVMIVKFEKPQRRFSASTAAPTFGQIANFVLKYLQVPPER